MCVYARYHRLLVALLDCVHMTSSDQAPKVNTPLAVRMRPTTLDELVGQNKLRHPGGPLDSLVNGSSSGKRMPSSIILWGPPGTGKTTLAHVIAHASSHRFVELSAITAGVKDVRTVMEQARTTQDLYGQSTVLFLDEIHRFSKAQQDALLPGVETGAVILVAATTENPSFSVISPLLSRSLLLTLEPLSETDIESLVERALASPVGLGGAFSIADDALSGISELASGDARRALTLLEASAGLAEAAGTNEITRDILEQASDRSLLRYDRAGDEHYDVISAFIKSMRGSDPDAAIHYAARMISAGEDPRFIARRMMIFAAEDIGMADPQALVVATNAATALSMIGMPEGRIIIGEAVIYLATAPKSNAAYMAIDRALGDVKNGKSGSVPNHLRDAHYPGAKALGHGQGYKYPHDDPRGVVAQQYLPDTLLGRTYYTPSAHGDERAVAERLERIRNIQKPPAQR